MRWSRSSSTASSSRKWQRTAGETWIARAMACCSSSRALRMPCAARSRFRRTSARDADAPVGKQILFRIGINVGDIIVDHDRIVGDGVNVAARLQSIAEPGGLCISGAVYDQLREKVDADIVEIGETRVKNIARPIRAFRVSLSNSGALLRRRGMEADALLARFGFIALLAVVGVVLGWQHGSRSERSRATRNVGRARAVQDCAGRRDCTRHCDRPSNCPRPCFDFVAPSRDPRHDERHGRRAFRRAKDR